MQGRRVPRAAPALMLAVACQLLAGHSWGAPTTKPVVRARYPHDTGAFTQGLLYYDGSLFESTGQRGRSTLRRVDPNSGVVDQSLPLPRHHFGEGLARVGSLLVQLTWQAGVAHTYALDTFEVGPQHTYAGEGWGLCYNGQHLVMSDGSSHLSFRDPTTFAEQRRLDVSLDGAAVTQLNELECLDGSVLANIWRTDRIVHVDTASGKVLTVIDAAGLLSPEQATKANVLNGIAKAPGPATRFFLTGKLWPTLFEVDLELAPVPAAGAPEPTSSAFPSPPPTGAASGEAPSEPAPRGEANTSSGLTPPSIEERPAAACGCRSVARDDSLGPFLWGSWLMLLGARRRLQPDSGPRRAFSDPL